MFRLCLFFAGLLVALKAAFIAFNWGQFHQAGLPAIGEALLVGLRFDAAVLGGVLLPAAAILFLYGATGRRLVRGMLLAYLVVAELAVLLVGLMDLQYFEESGKHMTYEATAYLDTTGLPVLIGGFQVHPWISLLSLAGCIGAAIVGLLFFGRTVQRRPAEAVAWWPRRAWIAALLWPLLLAASNYGGEPGRPLQIGHGTISSNPYINGLCLNPFFSAVHGAINPSGPEFQYRDYDSNVAVVRKLYFSAAETPVTGKYPLLRRTPGTARGNGRNVVLFILESWSGKDVGASGGPPDVTPVFDSLATQGAFFDRFYATGLRSGEGIFSSLCSYPNQPSTPIAQRPQMFTTRWRSLPEILDDNGYDTVFIHGRSLAFDQMRNLLTSISFKRLIERADFPPDVPQADEAWPGYDDDEVMKFAHRTFAAEGNRPFLGVIYTLNTHPPFMTPAGFPRIRPPGTVTNDFINSLHYSDHTLKTFFDLARQSPYFKNTIFLFVADHARTRDTFNFESQHHIPFLVYAPGYVAPQRSHVVGGQLDILPTTLGLLELSTLHASWGQDLLHTPDSRGFAISIAGNDVRWHDARFLLNDGLTDRPPQMYDLEVDRQCRKDARSDHEKEAVKLQHELRSALSLSQTLLFEDRVFPRREVTQSRAKGE